MLLSIKFTFLVNQKSYIVATEEHILTKVHISETTSIIDPKLYMNDHWIVSENILYTDWTKFNTGAYETRTVRIAGLIPPASL